MVYSDAHLEIALRLLAALAIGALIGMERSYHGRPAGFRTHILVCLASAVLMTAICMSTTATLPAACAPASEDASTIPARATTL